MKLKNLSLSARLRDKYRFAAGIILGLGGSLNDSQ